MPSSPRALRFLPRLLRRLLLLFLLLHVLRLRAILLTVHKPILSSRRTETNNARTITGTGIFTVRHNVAPLLTLLDGGLAIQMRLRLAMATLRQVAFTQEHGSRCAERQAEQGAAD